MTDEAVPPRLAVRLALTLLLAAVSYNVPLALVNWNVVTVSRGMVIGAEVLIIGGALALVATRWRADMTRWALMIVAFAALQMALTLLRQQFDPKTLRDTLMFAVFIMLGMTVPRADARRFLVGLQLLVAGVMLFEVLLPETYGALLSPRAYLIATRGFAEDQFYGETELFGAVRPDERYILPGLGWIRASSIFLEPLSVGNYAVFAVLGILLFWRDWRWPTRVLMVATWALILIGSDGRFAGITGLLLLALAPLLARLPAMLAALYLPIGIVVARVMSQALAWNPLEDTFTGRLARGMKQLFRLDTTDLIGGAIPTAALADSGIAYLVVGQSVLGVALLLGFLFLQPRLQTREQRLILHGVAIAFALSILVSISMLSIKTAALLWFYIGVVIAVAPMKRPADEIVDGPASKPILAQIRL